VGNILKDWLAVSSIRCCKIIKVEFYDQSGL